MIEHRLECPYCWQIISILIDKSEPVQSYIEDCEVCCNPITLKFEIVDGSIRLFEASKTE